MPRKRHRETNEVAADGRRLYSLGDACALTGASKAQAENWVRKQVIVPDYPASGTGNYRGFTFRNLVEFYIASWLAASNQPLDAIRGALTDLRLTDPDDDYYYTPRMQPLIEAAQPSRPPTKAEAMEWIRRQEQKGGIGSGDFTDARWLAEADANFAALDWPPPEGPDDTDKRAIARWRAFKDPATRRPGGIVALICGNNAGWLTFTPKELATFLARRPVATVVNLSFVFGQLETKTGDHWNRVGDAV